jgi:streptogramin lyase
MLGASFVVLTGPAHAAVGDIIQRAVPTTGSGGLNRITTGPDGNIWFTNPGANQIGRMTPGGNFTGFPIPSPNSSPIDITPGPDGNLWFTEFEGKIGRITPSGTITEFSVSPRHAFGITRGPDGALWFIANCCDPNTPGMIGRITTAGSITYYAAKPGTTPTVGITTGPDGNLWYPVIASNIDGRIQRMAPSGVVTGDFPIPTSYPDPSRLVAGPDGNIWFTEQGAVGASGCCQPTFPSPGKIGRITPSGQVTEFTTPSQNYPSFVSNPAGITAGPDGNLWFTEYSYLTRDSGVQHGGNKIGRITPSGSISEFPIPTPYARADGITGGPAGDGGVYFTMSPNNFAYGAVGRIQAVQAVPQIYPVPLPTAGPLKTSLTLKARPRRDRRLPFRYRFSGTVRIPAGVSKAAVCSGRVRLRLSKGKKTVARGTAKVSKSCAYKKTVAIKTTKKTGRRKGRLKVTGVFGGNARLKSSKKSTTVRFF